MVATMDDLFTLDDPTNCSLTKCKVLLTVDGVKDSELKEKDGFEVDNDLKYQVNTDPDIHSDIPGDG